MELLLWRHADAVAADEDTHDLERALTPKGGRQAKRMGQWLNQMLPAGTRVLVSPATRAQQTALGLDRKFKTAEALRPDAPVQEILEAVRWPDARDPVLVVGHQPTLGQVAARLVAGVDQDWAIPKGAVWWLRYRARNENGQVVVVTVRTPENP
jgi:phosphohistidine phosphatase